MKSNTPPSTTTTDAESKAAEKDALDRAEAAILAERMEQAASFHNSQGQHLSPGALSFFSKVLTEN